MTEFKPGQLVFVNWGNPDESPAEEYCEARHRNAEMVRVPDIVEDDFYLRILVPQVYEHLDKLLGVITHLLKNPVKSKAEMKRLIIQHGLSLDLFEGHDDHAENNTPNRIYNARKWGVYVAGPDAAFAAHTYEEALQKCDEFNALFLALADEKQHGHLAEYYPTSFAQVGLWDMIGCGADHDPDNTVWDF